MFYELMVKFRASFWDFIKDPTASALLLTLFSHTKVVSSIFIIENSVSGTCTVALFLSRLKLYTLTKIYSENY